MLLYDIRNNTFFNKLKIDELIKLGKKIEAQTLYCIDVQSVNDLSESKNNINI